MTYTQAKQCLKDTDKDTLRDLIESYGEELVYKYLDSGYQLDTMKEAYQGEWRSDEDFAYDLCHDCYTLDEHKGEWHPANYIDWERVTNDLMMDYFEIDGSYFRNL